MPGRQEGSCIHVPWVLGWFWARAGSGPGPPHTFTTWSGAEGLNEKTGSPVKGPQCRWQPSLALGRPRVCWRSSHEAFPTHSVLPNKGAGGEPPLSLHTPKWTGPRAHASPAAWTVEPTCSGASCGW